VIRADISNAVQNSRTVGYNGIENEAVLCTDPEAGAARRFLTSPRGCETTGVLTTPHGRTLFVNVQHPSESRTFSNNRIGSASTSYPTTVSHGPIGGRLRSATA